MVSVIEHQKVARRRKHHTKKATSSSRSEGLLFRSKIYRSPSVTLKQTRKRSWRLSPSNPSRFGRLSRSIGGSLLKGVATRFDGIVGRFQRRSSLRRWSVVEGLFRFEDQEVPVLTAAVMFAVLANLMLFSLRSDRIILSGVMSEIALPPQQELVVRSSFAPPNDAFDVIGEVSGVDPSQFARLEVSTYTVQPGDTLGEIALEYDLEMDTLISFNQIEDVRRLQAGATFEIPNRDGLLYTVKAGDSLASIASRQGSSVNAILDANDMRSQAINVGDVLFIPNARLNETERRIILGELFAWPTRGVFTSGYGMRADPFTGVPRFHNGIDLANTPGTPIRAAASGRVVHIESQVGNYGRFVIVRHPDSFQTLYAHLNTFSVREGQYVDRGAVLGTMGNTGRSTGPHLHFSVIHNGTFVDPLRYLH